MNYQIAVNIRQLLHINVLIKSPNWVKGTIVTFETGNIRQIREANQICVDPGNGEKDLTINQP